MEGSANAGDRTPRGPPRADNAQVKAAMEERKQRFLTNRQQYQPRLHEQINRLFQDYQPPVYARLRGYNREGILAVIESRVLAVSAGTERSFNDTEVQAVTEHLLDSIRNVLVWKWAMTGMAVYMTYRGRATWRFPFFKPPTAGRFSPLAGNPTMKFAWHSARFAAYYGVLLILGEPIFQGVNFMRQSSAMMADSRLSGVLRDAKALGQNQWGPSGLIANSQDGQQDDSSSWDQEPRPDVQRDYSEPDPTGIATQAQAAWTSYQRSPPPQQPSQQSSSWDTVPDVIDDASPIAPTSQNASNSSNQRGSAWDRVRQQSQYQPSQKRQQGQQTWEKPQATSGWGNDEVNKPHQGPNDSYSFSSENEERVLAKSQAQKEFDQLLERERSGVDPERRNSWGRR